MSDLLELNNCIMEYISVFDIILKYHCVSIVRLLIAAIRSSLAARIDISYYSLYEMLSGGQVFFCGICDFFLSRMGILR